jgi:hypothetical protein
VGQGKVGGMVVGGGEPAPVGGDGWLGHAA